MRGKIECDRKTRGAVGQEILITFIGLFGITHAGVLAHGPEPAAIHRRLNTASEGILAGIAHSGLDIVAIQIARSVERPNRNF